MSIYNIIRFASVIVSACALIPKAIAMSDASPLRQLVDMVETHGWHSPMAINDNLTTISNEPSFKALVSTLAKQPRAFATLTTSKGSSPVEFALLTMAAWQLPDAQYFAFIDDVLLYAEKDNFDPSVIEFLAWPSVGQPTFRIMERHAHEDRVKQILRRLRSMIPQAPYYLSKIDDLIALTNPKPSDATTDDLSQHDSTSADQNLRVAPSGADSNLSVLTSKDAWPHWIPGMLLLSALLLFIWIALRKLSGKV